MVSTHSRLKAAGHAEIINQFQLNGFNTQPPEGGWLSFFFRKRRIYRFNTQPPEGGWPARNAGIYYPFIVSTHSRLKAAGKF